MNYCGFLKYIFLVASFGLGIQVAGEENHGGELYNNVINETVESHLWNITDFNVTINRNNSIDLEEIPPCNLTCENNGFCKRENDMWKCECVGPYAGEYCEKDCDCGLAVCELDEYGYKKECNCTDHQALFKGKCLDCDCGNGSCRLDYRGKKSCTCRKDQFLHKGKCIDCDCGERSWGCFLDILGNKWCSCLPGSAQFEGVCQHCDCGGGTVVGCGFNKNGTVNCNCMQGFTQSNNTCRENCKRSSDCLNGGVCSMEKDGRFCKCRPGFTGARCRIDDFCNKLKEKCDAMGAVCKRDGDVRFCECPQGKTYRWNSGICENICDRKKCNFGTCVVNGENYSCWCKQGFTGLHCDEIDNSYDIKFRVIVLVILCVAIVGFFIATFCLIRRNTKLIKSLQQKNSIQ